MNLKLSIMLIAFSVILAVIVTVLLKKNRLPIKYSLIWYMFSVIILIVGIFPDLFTFFANLLGVQVLSNFVMGFIIAVLIIIVLFQSIMISSQKSSITLLVQDLSRLKSDINSQKKNKTSQKGKK